MGKMDKYIRHPYIGLHMQQAWNGGQPVLLGKILEGFTERRPENKKLAAGIPVNIPGTLQKSHFILVTDLLGK